jgi:hypothetical protein
MCWSQELLAFVVANRTKNIGRDDILETLRENLPEFMMPIIILMDGFPVKENFQVDSNALLQAYFNDRNESNWSIMCGVFYSSSCAF